MPMKVVVNDIPMRPIPKAWAKVLQIARNAGCFYDKDTGLTMKDIIGALLDNILEVDFCWSDAQCSLAFRELIMKYAEPKYVDILIATAGFEEPYRNCDSADSRRTIYLDRYPETSSSIQALRINENKRLAKMADLMTKDFQSGDLQSFILSLYSREDLMELARVSGYVIDVESQGQSEKPNQLDLLAILKKNPPKTPSLALDEYRHYEPDITMIIP